MNSTRLKEIRRALAQLEAMSPSSSKERALHRMLAMQDAEIVRIARNVDLSDAPIMRNCAN